MTTSGHWSTLGTWTNASSLDWMKKQEPHNDTLESENLRRYVELAIEIGRTVLARSPDLTAPPAEGSVSEGVVDPGTLKKTG